LCGLLLQQKQKQNKTKHPPSGRKGKEGHSCTFLKEKKREGEKKEKRKKGDGRRPPTRVRICKKKRRKGGGKGRGGVVLNRIWA